MLLHDKMYHDDLSESLRDDFKASVQMTVIGDSESLFERSRREEDQDLAVVHIQVPSKEVSPRAFREVSSLQLLRGLLQRTRFRRYFGPPPLLQGALHVPETRDLDLGIPGEIEPIRTKAMISHF